MEGSKGRKVYLALVPGSVGVSCQRELGTRMGRWSRWKGKRRAGGGCGETEKA